MIGVRRFEFINEMIGFADFVVNGIIFVFFVVRDFFLFIKKVKKPQILYRHNSANIVSKSTKLASF
jgi:hypothetical protein